jgi:diguanylate cyclase (GGDEF)-like protein
VGDALLKEAASIITQAIRGDDMASRVGGDEFVVLLDQVNSKNDVVQVIKRLNEIFMGVNFIAGHNVSLSASIGYSLFPEDGDTFETMLKVADKAMYRSKRDKKNQENNVIEFKDRS